MGSQSWTRLSDFHFSLSTKCLSWDKPLDFTVSLPPLGESDATSATEEQDVSHPVGWERQATAAVPVHKDKVLHVLFKKKKIDYNLENALKYFITELFVRINLIFYLILHMFWKS